MQQIWKALAVSIGVPVCVLVTTGCNGSAGDQSDGRSGALSAATAAARTYDLQIERHVLNDSFLANADQRTSAEQFLTNKHVARVSGNSAFKGGYLHCDTPQNVKLKLDAAVPIGTRFVNCSADLSSYHHHQENLTRALWYCGPGKTVHCLLLAGFVDQQLRPDDFGEKETILTFTIVNDSHRRRSRSCPQAFFDSEWRGLWPNHCVLSDPKQGLTVLIPLVGGKCPAGSQLLGGHPSYGYCQLGTSI